MGQLFQFEFRKLFRQKSFYICGAVLIGLVLISALTMNLLLELSQSLDQGFMDANGVSISVTGDNEVFTGLYMMLGAIASSNFSIVLAVFISLFVCSDYTNGTLKNVIARGYGRTHIYASKYIASLVAATIYTICCWLTGFLSGTAFWGVGQIAAYSSVSEYISILLLQLLGVFAYTSLFFFIAALFKKTGGAIAVGVVGPLMLYMGISMFDALIQEKSFTFADYWLDNCFAEIASTSVPSNVMTRCLVCFIVYIIVFTLCGHIIGRKNEV